MNYDAPNDAVSFVALVWAIWLGFLLAWLVKKSKIVSASHICQPPCRTGITSVGMVEVVFWTWNILTSFQLAN